MNIFGFWLEKSGNSAKLPPWVVDLIGAAGIVLLLVAAWLTLRWYNAWRKDLTRERRRLDPTHLIWAGMIGTVLSVLVLGLGVILNARPLNVAAAPLAATAATSPTATPPARAATIHSETAQPTYTPTRLTLKLGETRDKTLATDSANIWKWQILTLQIPMEQSRERKMVEGHSLFVVFDKPLGAPLKLVSKSSRPIKLVVQDLNSRSLLMNVEGDLFNNTLELVVEQGEGWTPRERPRMVGISVKGARAIVENSSVTLSGPGDKQGIEVEADDARASGNTVNIDDGQKPVSKP